MNGAQVSIGDRISILKKKEAGQKRERESLRILEEVNKKRLRSLL